MEADCTNGMTVHAAHLIRAAIKINACLLLPDLALLYYRTSAGSSGPSMQGKKGARGYCALRGAVTDSR